MAVRDNRLASYEAKKKIGATTAKGNEIFPIQKYAQYYNTFLKQATFETTTCTAASETTSRTILLRQGI